MSYSFVCSLCHNGLIGGGLFLENGSVVFKTNKLTVNKKFKNLVLPIEEIESITWQWIVFHVATFSMKNGEKYTMIIFNKSRFNKCYEEYENSLKQNTNNL